MSASPKKWLTACPLPYLGEVAWWQRDAGLLAKGLIESGVNARLVALGEEKFYEEMPLITAPLELWGVSSWWDQWGAEGVVIYSWALPQYEPVARAIKEAGCKLVIKWDCDGALHPKVEWKQFILNKYAAARERGGRCAWLSCAIRAIYQWVRGTPFQDKTIQHLSHADWVTVETPLALARLQRLFSSLGHKSILPKLGFLPHPVGGHFNYLGGAKSNLLLAVGRWDVWFKNAPLLVASVGKVLQIREDYSARFIGSGEGVLKCLTGRLPPDVQRRIEITGPMDNLKLNQAYQEAKILINPSHRESFHIASGEALCSGCSVVSSPTVAGGGFFASCESGSVANSKALGPFSDAILSEIACWDNGIRDPRAISASWRGKVLASSVADQIIHRKFS